MKTLSTEKANEILASVGMEVGSGNVLKNIESAGTGFAGPHWISFACPANASELFCFSFLIASWLPPGVWKLLQLGNGSSLLPQESIFCSRLAGLDFGTTDFSKAGSYLFEFGNGSRQDLEEELLIANLLFSFLLVGANAFLVSAASNDRQCLVIFDDFIYFRSDDDQISGARELLEKFRDHPRRYPNWLGELDTDS